MADQWEYVYLYLTLGGVPNAYPSRMEWTDGQELD
jgi:hypothetical protein